MQQYALELAIKKAKRYGYDKSYIPELYEEYMQVLELQEQSKISCSTNQRSTTI